MKKLSVKCGKHRSLTSPAVRFRCRKCGTLVYGQVMNFLDDESQLMWAKKDGSSNNRPTSNGKTLKSAKVNFYNGNDKGPLCSDCIRTFSFTRTTL